MTTEMSLGTSKTDITPQLPVRLGGFDFRREPCMQMAMPVFARCFVFNRQFAVVSLELLFAGDNLDRQIRAALVQIPALAALDVIITATHSHCSLQTADNHSPRLGAYDADYCAFVTQRVIDGLEQALNSGQPVTAHITTTDCPPAVHRRLMTEGRIAMAPNPQEPIDTTITLVRFTGRDTQVRAVLMHCQCHPTITGDNILSGEYPGVVCDETEARYPSAVCLMLQGFCGDIRPDLSHNGQFYRGDYAQMQRLGKQLADNCLTALDRDDLPALSFSARPFMNHRVISLPLQPPLSEEQLIRFCDEHTPDTIEREWAQVKLAQLQHAEPLQAARQITLTYLSLSPQLMLLTVSAEVVNHYQQWLRCISPHILGVGYSNGMAGYLPDARQIAEGGYEPDTSAYYFYLDAPFAPQAEYRFKEAVMHLSEEHTNV